MGEGKGRAVGGEKKEEWVPPSLRGKSERTEGRENKSRGGGRLVVSGAPGPGEDIGHRW